MQLGRASAFGVASLIFLAQQNRAQSATAEEIAKHTGIPIDYLRKILQRLSRSGLISSGRGRNGGFRLLDSSVSITLLHIVEAVEGPIREEAILPFDEPGSPIERVDRLKSCRQTLAQHLRGNLASIRLMDLGADSRDVYPEAVGNICELSA